MGKEFFDTLDSTGEVRKTSSSVDFFRSIDKEEEVPVKGEEVRREEEIAPNPYEAPVIEAGKKFVQETITAPLGSVAAGFNRAMEGSLKAFGFNEGAKFYQENAEYWEEKAKAPPLIKAIYQGIGSAPMGIAEFMAGPLYAGTKGATESLQRSLEKGNVDSTEYLKAVKEGAIASLSRYGIGKTFEAIHHIPMTQVQRAGMMGAVFGTQSSFEQKAATGTIDPIEVTAAAINGIALSMGGPAGEKAEIFKNLVKEGNPPKIALDLAMRDNPVMREAVNFATEGTGVFDGEVKAASIIKDLEAIKKPLVEPKEEQLSFELKQEPKTLRSSQGGMALTDITKKVIVEDIDGMYSGETGFDPIKVALRNAAIEKFKEKYGYYPDIISASTHRQGSLLTKDLRVIQEEYEEAGIKGRVAGVTPDLGADVPIANERGITPTRGNEVAAWKSQFGDRLGSEIIAVLDDRTDLGSFSKKQIVTTGGLGEEHISGLERLLGTKEPTTVPQMVREIETFDPKLKEHGVNVSTIAGKMADFLGVPPNVKEDIIHGAWVHDFGKLRVDKKILDKEGALTPEERVEIEKHPRVLERPEDMELPETVRNIVNQHHERFDGKGYPEGRTDISLEAQIVSAADMFEALTSKRRSYRKPMSQKELLKTFEEMRGRNLDPVILDALFETVGLKPESFKDITIPYEKTLYRGIAEREPLHEGGMGKGTYYTSDEKIAISYANDFSKKPGKVITTNIKLNNPYYADTLDDVFKLLPDRGDSIKVNLEESLQQAGQREQRAITDLLIAKGHDGIVLKNSLNPRTGEYVLADEVLVFPKELIKGKVPVISKEEAIEAKKQVVLELAGMKEEDPLRPAREIQLEQYNEIINGTRQYSDFQPMVEELVRNDLKEKISSIEDIDISTLSEKEVEISNGLKNILKSERGSFSTKPLEDKFQQRKEAEERIKTEYLKLERLAKNEKLSMEDYLKTKTTMEETQISEFIKNGEALVKGDKKIGRALSREVGLIKTALGLTSKEVNLLTKELTGLERFQELLPTEKEMVRDSLLFLYKEKTGEAFKTPTKVSIKKAQQEANKAFVDNSLSARGLYGVKEITQRVTSDGEYYLRTHGESAKALADKLSTIRMMSDLRFSDLYATKKLITKDLTTKEKERVQEIVETVKTSEIESLPDSDKIKRVAMFYREAFNGISNDMEVNGVKITNLKGERVPFISTPEEPYWPRYYNTDELLKPGRRHDAAVKEMVSKGYADTPAQAEVLLDRILSRRMNSPKYGNMEYTREFDVDGYVKDIDIVFDNYFQASTKRIEVIKAFGQQGKGALELLGRIKQESGDYVYRYAVDINKRIVGGQNNFDGVAGAFTDVAVSYEVLTKMGRAGIRNLGQSANTIGTSYIKSATRALRNIFSDPKTAMDRAQRAAAMLHSYANEFARFERGEEVSEGFAKAAELSKEVASKALTVSGFKHSEVFNRLFAAETGREYATDLFREFRDSPVNSRARRMSAMRLRKLGLDPEVIITERTELNEFDRRTAAYNFVRQTQFVSDSMSLPRWVTSENPWIKLLTLFKTFGMQQGKLVYRTLKTDPVMGGKLIAAMAAFGGLTAEAIDTLTNKVREDEDLLQRVVRYIVSGGGFGLWADTVQNSMKSSTGLAEALSGVVVSDVGTKAFALKKGLVDEDWTAFEKTMLRDIPIVGPSIYNYMEE